MQACFLVRALTASGHSRDLAATFTKSTSHIPPFLRLPLAPSHHEQIEPRALTNPKDSVYTDCKLPGNRHNAVARRRHLSSGVP